jgi:hypothetical protein
MIKKIISILILGSFVVFMLPQSINAQQLDEKLKQRIEYENWKEQFDRQQSIKHVGTGLIIGGGIGMVASLICYFTVKKSHWYLYDYFIPVYMEKERNPLWFIPAGISMAVMLTGAQLESNASRKIVKIKEEGRIKGYIDLGVIPKFEAVGVRFVLYF